MAAIAVVVKQRTVDIQQIEIPLADKEKSIRLPLTFVDRIADPGINCAPLLINWQRFIERRQTPIAKLINRECREARATSIDIEHQPNPSQIVLIGLSLFD